LLDPNGTGTVEVTASVNITGDVTIANQSDLRLLEATANGTNYIAQQAAANMAANYTITWPAAVSSTAGFVLTSDASGNLSWASAGGNIPVTDSGSTATVHYPFFGTAAGALPTTLSPLARANLSFVPSTGDLNVPIVSGASTNSATLTIRGTSSATKATASVLMTDGVASTSTSTGTLVVTGGVGISGAVYAASGVIGGTLNSLRLENIKSSSHTLELADRDRVVAFNGGGSQTVTVPPDSSVAFPVGSVVYINRIGAGTLALAAGAGVTLSKTGGFGNNEEIYCRKRDANNWIVIDSPKSLSATGGSILVSGGFSTHTYTSGSSSFVIA
jgi:hypothetical protein